MFKYKKIALLFLAQLVLTIIFLQSHNPVWRGHLEVDVYNYYTKQVEVFLQSFSFINLQNNEILPGTLIFLFTPLLFNLFGTASLTYLNYLMSFLLVNILLLFLHLYLYFSQRPLINSYLYLILLLALGPILLFRFELMVSLLVLLGFLAYKKKKTYLSFFLLGFAVSLKVYPIIFLPYLLLLLFFKKQYKKIFLSLSFFFIALMAAALSFFILGGNLEQLATSLSFHAKKPISIESTYGVVLTAKSLLTAGKPPALIGGYGVWGIVDRLNNSVWLNWYWIFSLLGFYIFLYFKNFFHLQVKAGIFMLLGILFLIFSKNLHPQYLFWFMSFIPLLKTSKKYFFDYLIIFFIAVIIALINQFIYPILYSQFLDQFYNQGHQLEIFYLQILRNVSIIFLFIVGVRSIILKKRVS